MADVAREAKVHQTTVSLALRNDPRLPTATRERLAALAEKMGYRPDPMLSALNFYRSSRDAIKVAPSVAFVTRSKTGRLSPSYYAEEQFMKGARQACARMGYRLVVFEVGGAPAEGVRLSRIFRSRGISGIILSSLDTTIPALDLDWNYFSAICIESQHLGLSLHTVANNQSGITRMAIRRLGDLGYRRIGLAVGEVEEAALGNPFVAGYLVEVHVRKNLTLIPPLFLRNNQTAKTVRALAVWIRRHRIDAVISNWSTMMEKLGTAGFKIPQDVGLATLDHNPLNGALAGMRQSHELVGDRAVEALALLMKTNQKGQITLPNTTLIDGFWQDGPELRRR